MSTLNKLNQILIKLLTLGLAGLPLAMWNGMYEIPKVFLFLVIGIISIFFILINFSKLVFNKVDKYYLLWLISLFVSGIFSGNINVSIFGGSYRHQGLVFFVCLWFITKAFSIFTIKEKKLFYKYFLVTALIESLIVLSGNKIGTMGDANAVSGYLALSTLLLMCLGSWLNIFYILGMFFAFSKTGFLSLIPLFYKKVNSIFIFVFILLIFIYKPVNLNSYFENRLVIWNHSISLILSNPLLGYGNESNERLYDQIFGKSGFPLSNLIIDRAHNLLLDLTIWSGAVGLILFSRYLYEKYKNISVSNKRVLLSFVIYSMFQPLSVVHWIFLALMV